MRAYKFLDAHGRAPFTGTRWTPGEWVEAREAVPCRHGVHACRPSHLAWWLDAALWEVELDGDVVEARHKVVASRGRLVRPVDGYAAAVRDLAAVGAWRAAALAVDALRGAGVGDLADRLVAASELSELAELAALGGEADETTFAGTAAGLAADAAYFALHGMPSQSPFVAACAAGHAAAGPAGEQPAYDEGYAAERVFQSGWLATRLELQLE